MAFPWLLAAGIAIVGGYLYSRTPQGQIAFAQAEDTFMQMSRNITGTSLEGNPGAPTNFSNPLNACAIKCSQISADYEYKNGKCTCVSYKTVPKPTSTKTVNPPKPKTLVCKPCIAGYTRDPKSTGCQCKACSACRAGYTRGSTGCSCKACSPCAKGYTRGSSGCSCKACTPCKAGYIRGSTGCSCKACTPCKAGYHRGSSGCSCVINKFSCKYGGCSGTTNASQCFLCRCRGICNNAAHGGVKSVSSNGSCYCNK